MNSELRLSVDVFMGIKRFYCKLVLLVVLQQLWNQSCKMTKQFTGLDD